MEYKDNQNNGQKNLDRNRDLIVLNGISIAIIDLQYLVEQYLL